MSEAKFAAVKELAAEGEYDAARAVLLTIPNDPKAQKWLARLNEVSPPPTPMRRANTSSEAERYYRAENKKRRRRVFGSGIELIALGVFLIIIIGAWTAVPDPRTGAIRIDSLAVIAGCLGGICIILGIFRLAASRRN